MPTAEPIEMTMNEDDEANREPASFPYFLIVKPAPHYRASISNADLEEGARDMADSLGLEDVKAKACKTAKCHAGPGQHVHVATRFPRRLAYSGLP